MCVCVGVSSLFRFSGHRSPPSHFFVFINRTCAGIHDLGLCVCVCVCFSLLLLLVVLIGRCCILFVMPSFSSFFFFFLLSYFVYQKIAGREQKAFIDESYLHVLDCARFWVGCVYVVSLSSDRMDLVIHLLRYFSFFYSPPSDFDTRQSNIVIHTATREIAFFSFFLTSDYPHRQRRDAWRWPTQQTLQK